MKTAIYVWQFKLCLHYLAEGMQLLLLCFVLDVVAILIIQDTKAGFARGFILS